MKRDLRLTAGTNLHPCRFIHIRDRSCSTYLCHCSGSQRDCSSSTAVQVQDQPVSKRIASCLTQNRQLTAEQPENTSDTVGGGCSRTSLQRSRACFEGGYLSACFIRTSCSAGSLRLEQSGAALRSRHLRFQLRRLAPSTAGSSGCTPCGQHSFTSPLLLCRIAAHGKKLNRSKVMNVNVVQTW